MTQCIRLKIWQGVVDFLLSLCSFFPHFSTHTIPPSIRSVNKFEIYFQVFSINFEQKNVLKSENFNHEYYGGDTCGLSLYKHGPSYNSCWYGPLCVVITSSRFSFSICMKDVHGVKSSFWHVFFKVQQIQFRRWVIPILSGLLVCTRWMGTPCVTFMSKVL